MWGLLFRSTSGALACIDSLVEAAARRRQCTELTSILLEELLVTRRGLRGELKIERQETGGCIERRDGGVTYGCVT